MLRLWLPPLQALNNKTNVLFDAHTVDIEISAGKDKLLRCIHYCIQLR